MHLSNLRPWQVLLCILVILGGIALGWVGRALTHDQLLHARQAAFEERAIKRMTLVTGRLSGAEESVRALANFLSARSLITHTAFETYALPVAQRNPAIRALDWIPHVRQSRRKAFEALQRKTIASDYEVRERSPDGKLIRADERADYLPIALSQPHSTNSVSLGFDIASNPPRLEAAVRARDSAAPAATGRLRLQQDDSLPTVRLLVPVYWGGAAPETREARNTQLWGYAGATLDLSALLVEDGDTPRTEQSWLGGTDLIDHSSDEHQLIHSIRSASIANDAVLPNPVRKTLAFGGRSWELMFLPGMAAAARGRWWPDAVFGVFMALSLLLTGLLASLFSSRALAEKIAEGRGRELTRERNESELILATMLDPLIVIDPYGSIKRFNPAAEKLFGYSEAEVLEQNVKMLMPEPHHSAHNGYLKHYRNEGEPRIIGTDREVMAKRRDGSLFPTELSVTEAGSDQERHFVGVIHDLTERKASERQLRLLEKGLQSAVNSIVISDTKGRIEWVNDAFVRMSGYAREEAIGQSTNLLKSGRHGLPFYTKLWETICEGKVWHGELENRRKDGTIYPEEMTITPVQDESGTITHYIAIKQDISERKRLERLKSEFVSTVSHELRTPLTSIRGSLGLLVGGAVGILPDKAKALAQIACNNSDRLVRLINDILDIEKIESGRMNFSLRPLLLAQIAQEAVSANEGFAREHKVSIAFEDTLPGTKVLADPDRLNQVITNLISNAAKFSPEGATVHLAISAHEEGVRLSVADSGPGIPADFRNHIFEKFTQADSTDTRKVGGTGLGLSISKIIVERVGGALSFDTEKDVGTAFHIDLPIWSDSPIITRGEHDGPAVLVCEDDAETARILSAIIETRGFAADVAYSAEEAWQKLGENDYSAMTLDLRLPGQDGLSLLRQMRGEARTSQLPVVIVTGNMTADAENVLAALNVEDWLLKPIDDKRLIQAIKRASDRPGKPCLLHVEDDPDIMSVVGSVIEDIAIQVPAYTLGEARTQLASNTRFDLILLDIELPDGSGFELLPGAAERGIPVVIFSAHEPGPDTTGNVASVLVKSRTDNARLTAAIERNLKRGNSKES